MADQTNRDSVRPVDYSDAGNADVFIRAYRGLLAYCDALGWLFFNGTNWERSEHKATDAALMLTDKMLREATDDIQLLQYQKADEEMRLSMGNEDAKKEIGRLKWEIKEAEAYRRHATKSRMAGRVKGILDLSIPSLHIKAAELDSDPFVLNTPSGIVDLKTGRLSQHDANSPYLWCTKITAVSPNDENMTIWYAFLEKITCGDASLCGFLQLIAGAALIGRVYHEGIFVAIGTGRNGKSTFFNALMGVLGDYAGTIDVGVLTTDRQNKGAALATLRGKRLVIASELEEHKRLSVSTLKQIASTDRLTIEEKYRSPETIDQTHTLVLFTNFMPRVGSTDDGTWRRLTVVPFNAVIQKNEDIPNFTEKLIQECGGAILQWAIDGAVNFCRNGFRIDIPDVVEEATDEYRARENWLENFVSDCCTRGPNERVGARDLYLVYKTWASEAGEFVRRENDFSAALEAAGYRKIKPQNKKTWIGLRLLNPASRWAATG